MGSSGAERPGRGSGTAFAVLVALSVSHLLHDTIQSLIAAVYPVLKESYALTFTQIGLITLAFQLTASLLQPLVGLYTDRRPLPYSLAVGMGVTLSGLLLLSAANTFPLILLAAALVGVGSAVFHPEASRMARLASGGRHGLAQSLFQVGGNGGSALGPLLAAFVVVRWGQGSLAWFSVAAVAAMVLLFRVGGWYRAHLAERAAKKAAALPSPVSPRRAALAVGVLLCLIFSKYFYLASLTSYYTLYLIDTFGGGVADAQLRLFVFLGAVAAGTFLGGPVGDRVGFKAVIWGSILGVLPFTLALRTRTCSGRRCRQSRSGSSWRPRSRPSWCTRRSCCPAGWGWWPGCSSDSRSGWAASARRRWAGWPTGRASGTSTASARSSR